jgi:hypothetical protein
MIKTTHKTTHLEDRSTSKSSFQLNVNKNPCIPPEIEDVIINSGIDYLDLLFQKDYEIISVSLLLSFFKRPMFVCKIRTQNHGIRGKLNEKGHLDGFITRIIPVTTVDISFDFDLMFQICQN